MKRREFVSSLVRAITMAGFGVFVFNGCEKNESRESSQVKKDPCEDLSSVPAEDLQLRKSYDYVHESPHTDKTCKNCEFYAEPEEGQSCATCLLFEGPVKDAGHCNVWSQQEA